jgi:hypothetical protein
MVCKDVLLATTCLTEAVAAAAGREQAWLWLHLAGRSYCALADALQSLAQPAAATEVSSDQPDEAHAAEIQEVLPWLLGQIKHVLTKRINKMLTLVAVPGEAADPAALASFNTGQTQVAVRAGPALRQLLELNGGAHSAQSVMEDAASRAAQQGSGAAVWRVMQSVPSLESKIDPIRQFGVALTTDVPVPGCCNSPGCVELGGVSEAGLVGGSRGRCSSCRAAWYCSTKCQRAHWAAHKPVCKRLNAAVLQGTVASNSFLRA